MNLIGILSAWMFSIQRPFLNGEFAALYLLRSHSRLRGWHIVLIGIGLTLIEWYVLFCNTFYYFNIWDLFTVGANAMAPWRLVATALACVLLYVVATVVIARSKFLKNKGTAVLLAGLMATTLAAEKAQTILAHDRSTKLDLIWFPTWSLFRSFSKEQERRLHVARLAPHGASTFENAGTPSSVYLKLAQLAQERQETVLVVVEALGYQESETWKAFLIRAVLGTSRDRAVTYGSDPAFGFTIHGEFRILCNKLLNGVGVNPSAVPQDCIPQMFSKNGLGTHSYHGYDDHFYLRSAWYPHLGFQTSTWQDAMGKAQCNFVFSHVCDSDVVTAFLDTPQAVAPSFSYILTLDAHLPLLSAVTTYIAAFGRGDLKLVQSASNAHELYLQVTENTLSSISDIVKQRPNATIIVTGDHAPYMLANKPSNRESAFAKDKVPYIIVSPARQATSP